MEKKLTCIVCPIGCSLKIRLDENNNVIEITGNTCPRGKEYAINECTNPVRVVTSTIRLVDGRILPVKTNKAIPKDKIFECMKIINSFRASSPINVGDVIISDVFGADIVATKNLK
jgi:CxxC motif-containing protein